MSLTVRRATTDDYPAIVELRNFTVTDKLSVERMHDMDRLRSPLSVRHQLVADDGAVVAYGRLSREPHNKEGLFFACIDVAPNRLGQGIGTMMFDRLRELLASEGGNAMKCAVRDDREPGLRFAEKRGFELDQYLIESHLDLKDFDPGVFDAEIVRVESAGIRLFAFDSRPKTDEYLKQIYEVNHDTGRDTPGFSSWGEPSFDDYRRTVCESNWFMPGGLWLAADGDKLVGLSMLGRSTTGDYYNEYSGVLADYRGKGIATALKIKAMEHAKNLDERIVSAHNDQKNPAMIAVNEKLGYRRHMGWKYMRKQF